ncbi:hypothetical protein GQF01_17960 [Paenibacillus sp. 5J-6]|uniref:Yip1 domain-containing protein n=1 Tax=Paenibacillus silvestris TaxID=2606219 RepID=A0A6L8V2Z3_9BACL|nr:YIP1 family protein [Paenibacillus silvestris]MZQ84002.1 hypothetical protein [Paenibacillus silvestris]
MQTELVNQETSPLQSPNLIGFLHSPVEHIKRLKHKAPIFKPFIIVCIVSMVYTGVISYLSVPDQSLIEASNAIHSSLPRLKLTTSIIAGLFSIIPLFFSLLIMAILLKLFLVFTHKELSFKTIFSLNIHMSAVTLLASTINLLINGITWSGQYLSYTNLGRLFINNSIWHVLFMALDPFVIWVNVLLAIGLHYLAGSTKVQIVIVISIVFLFSIAANTISLIKL